MWAVCVWFNLKAVFIYEHKQRNDKLRAPSGMYVCLVIKIYVLYSEEKREVSEQRVQRVLKCVFFADKFCKEKNSAKQSYSIQR